MRFATPSLTLVLVAALLTLALGCQNDEQKLAEFMERAEQYSEEEQHREAIIEYRNVLKIDPNNATAHYELSKSYMAVSKIKEAFWELNETVRLDPANTEARLSFGAMSLLAKDYDEALAQGEAVAEIDPEADQAYLLIGQALENLDRGEEAEESYKKSIELAPDNHNYITLLAGYYQRSDRSDQAEPLYHQATEVEPSFATFTNLGRFLAGQGGREVDAEAAFREALAVSEGDQIAKAHKNLAAYLFYTQREDEAIAILREGIGKSEEKLDLIYTLARYYGSVGETEKADALLREATEADTSSPTAFLTLSAYLGKSGDLEGALEAADSALEIDPVSKEARLRKAEVLVDLGFRAIRERRESGEVVETHPLFDEARSLVDGVLAEQPSLAQALFVRAKIAMAEERADDAVEDLRAAIDSKPEWAQAHFVLGSALALTADRRGARAELARAVELDPNLFEARRMLATLHQALGEHEYAIEQGRIYLRAAPDHTRTRILVAQSLIRIGKRDEALAELNKIPEEKRSAESLFAVARIVGSQGKSDEAYALLLQVQEQVPSNPKVLRALLDLERSMGKLELSKQRIYAASEANPENSKLMQLKGLVAMLSSDMETAQQSFTRATELDPDDVTAYQQLANFYRATGRLDETIQTYERAIEARPDSAKLYHFLAVLYELDGRSDLAMKNYEAAVERDPSHAQAKNNLAYMLAESGEDLDRALDLAQEAKALLPEDANTADTLGWVLYKRGVPSAAVGYLKEAADSTDPDNPNLGIIRYHLALAYEADGQKEKAAEVLERAVTDLDQRYEAAQAAGRKVAEPPWEKDLRQMLDRLKAG
ncbi:MAG: tetratricopeptide repeat protein [Deltaproteobacteria bacterium]|nr:tetratricopeptide repeat protein [Deltaproteobacteria bacterium]MBW2417368.1 tetratricopeptide repeat protein [Deltaproteobacteria bacterium]